MYKKISLDGPNVGTLEKRYLCKAIDSGYISSAGPLIPEFEAKFSKYLKVKKAVATQSGTAALHMALHELKIGKGDEVIVPDLTFVATVNPVLYVGATPVFADVDLKTWTIDPKDIEAKISRKTKAIIIVHVYGNPCHMDAIQKIARKHKLYLIEDATESLGALYKGRMTGTFGDMGCFSFNGNKVMTTGGGGIITSPHTKRMEHIRYLVNQAKLHPTYDEHAEIGFNYRMTNLEAAMGISQLKRLKHFISRKKAFQRIYREELVDETPFEFQEAFPQAKPSYWMSCIMARETLNINSLQSYLKKSGIPTRRAFAPLSSFPPYRKFMKTRSKNASFIHQHGLCLPSSTLNNTENVQYACRKIKDFIKT